MINLEMQPEVESYRLFLSKGEYVYRQLKQKIVNGQLERNKVYTIVEIAENLGVSRTPVGEAVKILASQNYIILTPGVGFKIKELTIADIRETLVITGALEEVMLRKIVKDGTAPTEKLKEALIKSREAVDNHAPTQYTQASADFHRALSEMSNLPRVTEILNENVLAHEIFYIEGASRYPQLIQRLIVDHADIIDLIQKKDYERITETINNHVENCVQILSKVIKD
jgi:DNA-binding GntR family transcriptional regulator